MDVTAAAADPPLSQIRAPDADREALTKRIQFGGDEVVQAKAGAGSATPDGVRRLPLHRT